MVLRQPRTAAPIRRLRWQLEVVGVRLILALLHGRSHRTVRRGIHLAHQLAQPWLAQRQATACSNLQRVYGSQISGQLRQVIAARSIDSFFLSCLESIIRPVDPALLTVEGEGLEALFRLHRQGQGVIIGSLHLGCWDLALRWLSERIDNLAVIYRPARNPHSDRLLNRARSANSHCSWIPRSDARAVLRHLRQGGSLVLMTDLYSRKRALQVDFLGLSTGFGRGPAALSQASGCPLFPVAHVREDDGRFRLICGPPLWPGQRDDALSAQMADLARWHEPWIHAYTEQYYWINRRWRPGDGSGLRLRPTPPPTARVLQLAAAPPQP